MAVSPTDYQVFAEGQDEARITRNPLPNSNKTYVEGSDSSNQVPMRESTLSATEAARKKRIEAARCVLVPRKRATLARGSFAALG